MSEPSFRRWMGTMWLYTLLRIALFLGWATEQIERQRAVVAEYVTLVEFKMNPVHRGA